MIDPVSNGDFEGDFNVTHYYPRPAGSTTSTSSTTQPKTTTAKKKKRPGAGDVYGVPTVQQAYPTRESAYAIASDMASRWGLGSDAGSMLATMSMEYTDPNVLLAKFRDTDMYNRRFPVQKMLLAQGKAVYDEGQLIGMERSYSEALKQAGIPQGFYDDPRDFAQWIVNDVSPVEVSERATMAVDVAKNMPNEVTQAFKEFYGIGESELATYFLDPKKGKDFLERRYKAAQIGGEAIMQDLDYGAAASMDAAKAGVTAREARGAMTSAAMETDEMAQLGAIDGVRVTDQNLVNEQLGIAKASTVERTRRLRSKERARFAGQGAGTETFGSGSSGSF